jgi:hypothetical protein
MLYSPHLASLEFAFSFSIPFPFKVKELFFHSVFIQYDILGKGKGQKTSLKIAGLKTSLMFRIIMFVFFNFCYIKINVSVSDKIKPSLIFQKSEPCCNLLISLYVKFKGSLIFQHQINFLFHFLLRSKLHSSYQCFSFCKEQTLAHFQCCNPSISHTIAKEKHHFYSIMLHTKSLLHRRHNCHCSNIIHKFDHYTASEAQLEGTTGACCLSCAIILLAVLPAFCF